MSFNTARMKAGMDTAAATITHVAWSADGSTETGSLARTAVTVKAATTANPSVIANDGALESAEASADVTITHFAFHDGTGIVTTWNELDAPAVLLTGGKVIAADGALTENWHQTTSAPA
jgi:hypothetical protein